MKTTQTLWVQYVLLQKILPISQLTDRDKKRASFLCVKHQQWYMSHMSSGKRFTLVMTHQVIFLQTSGLDLGESLHKK